MRGRRAGRPPRHALRTGTLRCNGWGQAVAAIAEDQAVRRGARASARTRQRVNMLIFLGPAILLTLAFFVLPVIVDIAVSFTDLGRSLDRHRGHHRQYQKVFGGDHRLTQVVGLTFIFVFSTLAIFNVTFALLLALLTTAVPDGLGALLPRRLAAAADEPVGGLHPAVAVGGRSERARPAQPDPVHVFGMRAGRPAQQPSAALIILANGFIGASLGMIIFTSAIRSIPEHLFHAAPRRRRGRARDRAPHHAAGAALADLLHDDPPDAVAAGELRVHPADHRRRPVLRHDGVLALRLSARVRERPVRVWRGAVADPDRRSA